MYHSKMKTIVIRTFLFVLLTLPVLSSWGQLTADPVVAAAVGTSSALENGQLKKIDRNQNRIVAAQALINAELSNIKNIQKKTYDYLSNVSAFVENAHDVKKAYGYTKQIWSLCDQLKRAIAQNPQGAVTTAVGTAQIKRVSKEVMELYSYVSSLTLNKKVLLNAYERLTITTHVVYSLQSIAFQLSTLVYDVYALSFKDLPRLLAPEIYYSTISKKTIAEDIIRSW